MCTGWAATTRLTLLHAWHHALGSHHLLLDQYLHELAVVELAKVWAAPFFSGFQQSPQGRFRQCLLCDLLLDGDVSFVGVLQAKYLVSDHAVR